MIPKAKAKQHAFHGEMHVRVNKRIHPDMTEEKLTEIIDGIIQSGKIPEGIEVRSFKRGYGDGKLHDKTKELVSGEWTSDTVGGFITGAKRRDESSTQNRKSKERH